MPYLPQRWMFAALLAALAPAAAFAGSEADPPWVVYDGFDGPGEGRHIVLVSGDEEYRSEEALPQLGKILARRHGFKCTVLFAIDPDTGQIDPEHLTNIPGLHRLKEADLMVIFTRFRNLPNEQMASIDRYLRSGRPVLGIRTATHGFKIPEDRKYHRYDWQSEVDGWEGGFGRRVLGETWIAHHGKHGEQSTRGIIDEAAADHPITNGVADGDIWGPTDVYKVRLPLPGDSKPLVRGQVLTGMEPDSEPVTGGKNDPMLPIVWARSYQLPDGEEGRAVTSTIGASVDLKSAGLRRVLVNACYHLLGMDVPAEAEVSIVGDYEPTMFGFGEYKKGLTPDDFRIPAE